MSKGITGQRVWSHLLRRPIGSPEGRRVFWVRTQVPLCIPINPVVLPLVGGFSRLPSPAERGRGGCHRNHWLLPVPLCGKLPLKSASPWGLCWAGVRRDLSGKQETAFRHSFLPIPGFGERGPASTPYLTHDGILSCVRSPLHLWSLPLSDCMSDFPSPPPTWPALVLDLSVYLFTPVLLRSPPVPWPHPTTHTLGHSPP